MPVELRILRRRKSMKEDYLGFVSNPACRIDAKGGKL
jgi:hypothetical protein